jgi:hypothetical protein
MPSVITLYNFLLGKYKSHTFSEKQINRWGFVGEKRDFIILKLGLTHGSCDKSSLKSLNLSG